MTTNTEKKHEDFNFTTAHVASYADIMEPRAFQKNGQKKGDPKYATTFVIDPTPVLKNVNGKDVNMSDLAQLQRAVTALLQSKAPGKKIRARRLTQEEVDAGDCVEVQVPWKDGTKFADAEKAKGKDAEYARGKVLLKASSKYQPALAAIVNGKIVEFTTDESKAEAKKYFYSGAHLVPSVGLHWYKGDEGKPDGVSLYFNGVLFAKHGSRLGGRQQNASETFKGYIGSISNEDPTGGASDELDDEIPF